MHLRRTAAAALVAALAAVGAGPASGQHCASKVSILSRVSAVGTGPSANPSPFVCLAGEYPDARLIVPGANEVIVRYAPDVTTAQSFTANLTGLLNGFVVLTKKDVVGGMVYESGPLAIDPLARSGWITATVVATGSPSATYRTAL